MKALFERILALGLLIVVMLMAWFGVAQPVYSDFVREREQISNYQDNLQRFGAIAGKLQKYQDDLIHQRQNPELNQAVLRADSGTLAAADLQQRVKSVVEGQGGSVVSTQVLEMVPQSPFTQIKINVRMLLNVPVLQQVLYDIESQTPYLMVRQLLVTNRHWRGRKKPRQSQQAESLDVRMVIVGYWYPSQIGPKAGSG